MYLCNCIFVCVVFFFKQKTAYEMRISDWSSDVCSSDLVPDLRAGGGSGLVHIISFARRERLHRYQPIRASASSRTWDIRIPVTGRSRGAIQLKDGTVANRSAPNGSGRSEEHTSELQSLMRISYAVFCLKKNTKHRD